MLSLSFKTEEESKAYVETNEEELMKVLEGEKPVVKSTVDQGKTNTNMSQECTHNQEGSDDTVATIAYYNRKKK